MLNLLNLYKDLDQYWHLLFFTAVWKFVKLNFTEIPDSLSISVLISSSRMLVDKNLEKVENDYTSNLFLFFINKKLVF